MTALTAESSTEAGDIPPPQSNFAKYNTVDRLVWHQFQGIWWPGVFYGSLQEFNTAVLEELDKRGDKAAKARLSFHLMNKFLAAKSGGDSFNRGIVRYLGRPFFDFQHVDEGEYQSYCDFLWLHLSDFKKPEIFGQDKYQLYMDFHRGLDEARSVLEATFGAPCDDNGGTFEEMAQKAWDEMDWDNVDPQQPQQERQQQEPLHHDQEPRHHHPEPPSPNTNSVAAVSLADESLVSANTSTTGHQSWTETPMRDAETTPAAAKETPALDSSPINKCAPWPEVWSKMCFSDWRCKSTAHGKIYSHPNFPHKSFDEEEIQQFAKERYGWLGEMRARPTTRGSAPKRASPEKPKSFGVLWKGWLKPEGWKMIKAKGQGPIEWYYVKPGRSVEVGVEGQDYFTTTHDVEDYCQGRAEYQSSSSSSSESEVSPDPRNQARQAMDTDDDDESTKLPPETDEDTIALTPRDQRTKPQDPAKAQIPSSAESEAESVTEEDRYKFSVLWRRLQEEGWKWIAAKNKFDGNWYVPPSSIEADKDDRNAWKEWTCGIDYFVDSVDMVEYIKMKEGAGMTEEEYHARIAAQMEPSQSLGPRRAAKTNKSEPSSKEASRKEKQQQKAKKADERKKKSKSRSDGLPLLQLKTGKIEVRTKAAAAQTSRPAATSNIKEEKRRKRTKDSEAASSSKNKQPERKKKRPKTASKKSNKANIKAADIDVRFHGEFNQAPWVVNPLTPHLHSSLINVGFSWMGHKYYLPGETPSEYTERFESAQEAIQYCGSEGNLDLSSATAEERAIMERLIAYANVPEMQSTWSSVRAITTKETVAFLEVLQYEALANGSWKASDAMVPFLKQQEFESLEELILTLRRSDTLIPKGSGRRSGPLDNVLRKDQMLALRLRIAEGLGNEAESESSSESSSSESSEEESVAPTSERDRATKKTRQNPESETESPSETESTASSDEIVDFPAASENNNESDDDSIAINNAVASLRASQIDPKVGLQLLQRVGCRWQSSSYRLPGASDQRFSNQNDLVHYILNNSCLVLDFGKDPLSKAELQDLHRYLKFQHVSLKCAETVGKALSNMMNTDNIVALLEKIGFKKLPNGHFKHAHVDGEVEIAQVINAIRAQREDLKLIGLQDSRARLKEPLSLEDDYTLRIWAAESDIPLQFFDEDTNCKEAMEDNELMDEDEENKEEVSEEIDRPSEHSNVGDRVFEVEEADTSNTGFVNQTSSERMPLFTQPQDDESECESDFAGTPSSLFKKAILSPNEKQTLPKTVKGGAAMENGGVDEFHDCNEGRSDDFNVLADETIEQSSLQIMDEDDGEASNHADSMPFMTQEVEED